MSDLKTEQLRFHDGLRGHFLKYTKRAFDMLPYLERPRILDIGCGTGVPTVELARLSGGEVTGIDVDQPCLDEAVRRIKEAGLSDRVQVMNRSMLDMDFPDESFDIVWAEGSIAAMGFERGLKEWRRLLRPGGFLTVHDEMGNVTAKLEQISGCGYDLLDYFTVGEDAWRDEYYAPLEAHIGEMGATHGDGPEIMAMVEEDRRFIEAFKKNPERDRAVFFVMRKR